MRLSRREEQDLFIEIWQDTSPETYEALWYPGITMDVIINDLVEVNPKLYRRLLNLLEKEIHEKGYE